MISIFTIPKAFKGHIGVIQRNAVRSWLRMAPDVQVIICGDDPGCGEVAEEIGATWLPDIERNEFGTPMLNDAFGKATAAAKHELIAYSNADIMLFSDVVKAAKHATWPAWLMIGRRVDLDITEDLSDALLDDTDELRAMAERDGALHGCGGIDYFVWPKSSGIGKLPPLAVGRPGWDNYFVSETRYTRGLPLIDATGAVLAIHQNHDYRHVPGGNGKSYEGPEADRQRAMLGAVSGSVFDATHVATAEGMERASGYAYRRARWKRRWVTRRMLEAESFIARATAPARHALRRAA